MATVFSLGVCHLATAAWQSVLGTFHQPHHARSGPSQRIQTRWLKELPCPCYQYCLFTLSRDRASRDSIWAFGKGGQQVTLHSHFRSRCYLLLTWSFMKELMILWLQRLFSATPHKSSSTQTHFQMDLLWDPEVTVTASSPWNSFPVVLTLVFTLDSKWSLLLFNFWRLLKFNLFTRKFPNTL